MHLEVLDGKRINLLKDLSTLKFMHIFSMGGGTSLALQFGTRMSYDFDFFTDVHFDVEEIKNELDYKFKGKIKYEHESNIKSSLDVLVDGVKISFFEYSYPILFESEILDICLGIILLSPKDILAMKIVAINQRGSKKDFYDFAVLSSMLNIHPEEMIQIVIKKFNNKDVLTSFALSMIYFEDAEDDVLPMMFIKKSWAEVKSFFLHYNIEYMKALKGLM